MIFAFLSKNLAKTYVIVSFTTGFHPWLSILHPAGVRHENIQPLYHFTL